jgi:hypothetical protein
MRSREVRLRGSWCVRMVSDSKAMALCERRKALAKDLGKFQVPRGEG